MDPAGDQPADPYPRRPGTGRVVRSVPVCVVVPVSERPTNVHHSAEYVAPPMRFAYADPPYAGQARKHYGPDAQEVNHELLIAHLAEFDGWALSVKSNSLRDLLPICPDGTRVGAWIKKRARYKKNVNPAYTWEPVLFWGGRRGNKRARPTLFVHDSVDCPPSPPFKGHPGSVLVGAKPRAFCYWLFDLLGMEPEDELVDLFPGSGSVSDSWAAWRAQGRLEMVAYIDGDPRG